MCPRYVLYFTYVTVNTVHKGGGGGGGGDDDDDDDDDDSVYFLKCSTVATKTTQAPQQ
jgi:hypothetical protein